MLLKKIIDELLNRKIKNSLVQLARQSDSIQSEVSRIPELENKLNQLGGILNQLGEILNQLRENVNTLDGRQKHAQNEIQIIKRKGEVIEKEVRSLSINIYNENSNGHEYVKKIFDLLTLKKVKGDFKFCRMGRDYDGGYVMLDDFVQSKIAYSFGINDDVSWDKDMAKRGIDVYMYDPTINCLPEENERFHFFKVGVSGPGKELPFPTETLDELIKENKHGNEENMILKLDVEESEWEVLANSNSEVLNQFNQILVEMHYMNNPANLDGILKALNVLNKTHQAVHIHANNYCTGVMSAGRFLPDVLEVTYLRRGKYEFEDGKMNLPIEYDMQNDLDCPDICLGKCFSE